MTGEVAVIVSNVGKDPSDEIRRQMAAKVRERLEQEKQEQIERAGDHVNDVLAALQDSLQEGDPLDRRFDQGAHEAYVMPDGFRGIQERVVGPGKYYVNTLAVSPIIIPTTNQTVEWTGEQVQGTFDPFEVISKDGFTMQLDRKSTRLNSSHG